MDEITTANAPYFIDEKLKTLRETAPLVHNITNYVVMNYTANVLLALGASPVMAHALEEVEDMVGIASALVLNMGTLSPRWVDAMLKAGRAARKRSVPVIFDPVGAGATPYRTETAFRILDIVKPDIVRGNASEIAAVFSEVAGKTKGVDNALSSDEVLEFSSGLMRDDSTVIVISGAEDIVMQGDKRIVLSNGSPMMPKVTGMGCSATAVIGAFAGVASPFEAAICGMAVMSIAGEVAEEITVSEGKGLGTFQINFIDAIANIGGKDMEKARINIA